MGLNVGGGTKLLEKWDEVVPTYVGYIQYIEDKSISGHFPYVMVFGSQYIRSQKIKRIQQKKQDEHKI